MPKLHVIYDPVDKLVVTGDSDQSAWMEKNGIMSACLSLKDHLSDEEVSQYAKMLSLALLEQLER